MNKSASTYLLDPYNKQELQLHCFETEAEVVNNGVFINRITNNIFPIIDGVPIFILNRIPFKFFNKFRKDFEKLLPIDTVENQLLKKEINFSFSEEWQEAHTKNMTTVWGQTTEIRLKEHFNDTQTNAAYYPGKIILDVGCGNGILSHELALLGATVFGIDYSSSVWNANARLKNPKLCYIQCDLHFLPFKNQFFDLLYSNGVLHHTPNTYNAFRSVISSIKPQGICYIWLYCRSMKFGFNMFLYSTDVLRFVVNKLNNNTQKKIIEKLLSWKIKYNTWRGKDIPSIIEAKIDLYDILTPTYKFYHTTNEVREWYSSNDFEQIATTHANNIYGFGMMGVKNNLPK